VELVRQSNDGTETRPQPTSFEQSCGIDGSPIVVSVLNRQGQVVKWGTYILRDDGNPEPVARIACALDADASAHAVFDDVRRELGYDNRELSTITPSEA
jgi:hypothetical protein